MALKKKAAVKTGKMIRELMLADKDVSASTIMVYSNNGLNEEIKIEGLHPKSNEELFFNDNMDWNDTVIYKIVDFSGKAEVGKVTLLDMKNNNITLRIERIMWSKENQEEVEVEDIQDEVPTTNSSKEPLHVYITEKKPEYNSSYEKIAPSPSQPTLLKTEAVAKRVEPVKTYEQPTPANPKIEEHYQALVSHAIAVCQDYTLGLDIDESIEKLKEELASQGAMLPLDSEIIGVVSSLRELKGKGMDLQKLLSLV
ncbi:hypothetical protein [Ectobacillus sp. sgz5001026]|uniref:hypothetical protein n=1 Tax=Ectobacillus sp. sgz5001026 TaxID=3242473 RepID=UPI0036D3C515